MAEASRNVRLVRCPQCGNLLPELQDFSVYQCGGCGIILRAKKKGGLDDALSETSHGERVRAVADLDQESGEFELSRAKEKRNNERMLLHNRFTSGFGNKDAFSDYDKARKDGPGSFGPRLHQLRGEKFYGYDECSTSKGEVDNSLWVDDCWGQIGTAGYEREKMRPPMESLSSGPAMDRFNMERHSFVGSHPNFGDAWRKRFSSFPYPNEGPLGHDVGSYYDSGNHRRYNGGFDGVTRVVNLENDRAELLRKIDELENQLSKTCDVSKTPKDRIPVNGRMTPTTPDPYSRNDVYNQDSYGAKHPAGPAKNVLEHPHIYGLQGNVPYMGRHSSMMQESFPSNNFPHESLGYNNAYQQHVRRRHPHETPYQNLPLLQEHFPGSCVDDFMSHPHGTHFHQSACSCSYCINEKISHMIQPSGFASRRSQNGPANPILYHNMNSVGNGPQAFTPERTRSPSNHYHDGWRPTNNSSDLDLDNGGLGHWRYPKRVVLAHGTERVYQAIAGGAPFIMCCNCFELLKLPKKLRITKRNEKKLRCGGCSSIILLKLGSNGLDVFIPTETKQVSAEFVHGSTEVVNENLHSAYGGLRYDAMSPGPDDCDKSNYNYHLTDAKLKSSPRSREENSCESEKMDNAHSPSSSFSEIEQSPDSLIIKNNDVSHPAVFPPKDDASLHLPDSSHNYNAYHLSSKDVQDSDEDITEHTDQERTILDKTTSSQNSVKDLSVATELDVSRNEFVNKTTSGQNSVKDLSMETELDVSRNEFVNNTTSSQNSLKNLSVATEVDVSRNEFVNKTTSSQNSVKDLSVATELDVSRNEFPNSDVSLEAVQVSKEEDLPKFRDGGESITGFRNRRFEGYSRSSQTTENGRVNVFVNGKLIPDRAVKMAEKLAGSIQPGDYWYDYRAGFWGVMGYPCLGIIPPNIQEFKYPIPVDCAAGNTEVFVNGRELNEKDLDLLASRGLPIARNKSYFVEISGRVFDEHTGEELDGLGKLAPTVERVNHGFGMKIPKAIAEQLY